MFLTHGAFFAGLRREEGGGLGWGDLFEQTRAKKLVMAFVGSFLKLRVRVESKDEGFLVVVTSNRALSSEMRLMRLMPEGETVQNRALVGRVFE